MKPRGNNFMIGDKASGRKLSRQMLINRALQLYIDDYSMTGLTSDPATFATL